MIHTHKKQNGQGNQSTTYATRNATQSSLAPPGSTSLRTSVFGRPVNTKPVIIKPVPQNQVRPTTKGYLSYMHRKGINSVMSNDPAVIADINSFISTDKRATRYNIKRESENEQYKQRNMASNETQNNHVKAEPLFSAAENAVSAVKQGFQMLEISNNAVENFVRDSIPFVGTMRGVTRIFDALQDYSDVQDIQNQAQYAKRRSEKAFKKTINFSEEQQQNRARVSLYDKISNEAEVRKHGLRYKVASGGALILGSAVSPLNPLAKPIGSALGMGLEKIGDNRTRKKRKDMMKAQVFKKNDINKRYINDLKKTYKIDGKELSQENAEFLALLEKTESYSVQEAFLKDTVKEKEEAGPDAIEDIKRITRTRQDNSGKQLNINLGVKEKYANNLMKSIPQVRLKHLRKDFFRKPKA